MDSSHPLILSAEVTDTESFAIRSAVETLTGEESQSKEDIISGIFSGEGELQGVTCKEIVLLVELAALTKDVTLDSRFIEIAQVVKHSHQHLSGEDVIEGTTGEPEAGAGTTAHGHAGSLLFVQESELDSDAPPVGDVPPADEEAVYEQEPEPESKSVEVTELVSIFASLPYNSADTGRNDQIVTSAPIDWSAEDEHDLPPISGLQESFGGEAQPAPPVVDDQVPPEDDGFTTRSGRGRGPRGERRGGRGGYRGEGGGRGYGRGGAHGDRDRGGRGCE